MARTKQDTPTSGRRPGRRGLLDRGRRRAIGRTIALLALLPMAEHLPAHARIMLGLIGDPRVPASRKALLALSFGYAVAPIDIVPDRFPIIAVFDDVIVTAAAIDVFLAGVPDEVLDERLAAAGLSRAAFEEDVQRMRRLVPGPVRQIAHRIPAAIEFGARVAREAEVGPRLRGLLSKEGSPA